MKFKDYYQILGVARDADAQALKRAYRRLARKYHPDVSSEPDAQARFIQVGEAYEVLKDANKRTAYDNLGAGWCAGQDFTPPPQWSSFFRDGGRSGQVDFGEFSEFFQTLFGHEQADDAQVRRSEMPGADAQYIIKVSLEEAYQGAERTIQMQAVDTLAGSEGMRDVQVKIPAGVTHGQRIRLAGQGRPGPGGRRGDLFLTVHLQAHQQFTLHGCDVYLVLPVTPWEVALGATVKAPTLKGVVDLKIPAGSNSGSRLRLRGRGLGRDRGGDGRGDLYVELQVHTPMPRTAEDEAMYRAFAEQMEFNPRQVQS
jgi:curved DNA-binding protein